MGGGNLIQTHHVKAVLLMPSSHALFLHANTNQAEGVASTFWQIQLR